MLKLASIIQINRQKTLGICFLLKLCIFVKATVLFYDDNDVTTKPMIYTYIEDLRTVKDNKKKQSYLELWKNAWELAGWETKVLTHETAQAHAHYNTFYNNVVLYKHNTRTNPIDLLKYLAMSTIVNGGYFSELFALPLLRFVSHEKASSVLLPNNGRLTIFDLKFGSIISADQNEWNRMTMNLVQILPLDEANHDSISSFSKSFHSLIVDHKPLLFHAMQDAFLLENTMNYKLDICDRVAAASTSRTQLYFVRIHEEDLKEYRNEITHYLHFSEFFPQIVHNWFQFYTNLCWNVRHEKDLISYTAYEPPSRILTISSDEATTELSSTVHCDAVSCHVENACVDAEGVISIFGSNKNKVQEIIHMLQTKITHEWKCHNCQNQVRAKLHRTIAYSINWKHTATLSSGLSFHNCGHHIGDHLWPLIRLHLKFKTTSSLLQTTLGTLFLSSPPSPCDGIYNAISHQVLRYSDLESDKASQSSESHKEMCFENLFVGTRRMKYMIDIPNSYFINYDHFHRDMNAMRDLFYNQFGCSKEAQKNLDTILITHKRQSANELLHIHKHHNIKNIPTIIKSIQYHFPKYKIEIISWEDYTMKQQIQLLHKTKLVITLPGSAVMNAFLLPNESFLFCYCQRGEPDFRVDTSTMFVNQTKIQLSNEIRLWFQYFHHGTFMDICNEHDVSFDNRDIIVNVDALLQRMRYYGF